MAQSQQIHTPRVRLRRWLRTHLGFLVGRRQPKTVDEAAAMIIKRMSPATRDIIRGLEEQELVRLHHSVGAGIRNRLHLWTDSELVRSLDSWHPDHASQKILLAIRRSLLAEASAEGLDRARAAGQEFREQDREARERQRSMVWVCPACGLPSFGISGSCRRCGQPRTPSASDDTEES